MGLWQRRGGQGVVQAGEELRPERQFGPEYCIDRLVLCKEGTTIPRTFVVAVQRNEFGNYTAQIVKETTPNPVASGVVITRYGLGASDNVVKYSFDGTMPKEQRQQAKKDGVVRFNLIGAQIGLPQAGGMSND